MPSRPTYEQLYASFRWNIPARYNIAADVCDRHAGDPGKVALIGEDSDGKAWKMTFREVQRRANQLANLLLSLGLVKGDRVLLLLGQNAWTAIAHVACWKAGLVSVPTSILFAADAVAYRLNAVGVRVVITDLANLPSVEKARHVAPAMKHVFLTDGAAPNAPVCPAPGTSHNVVQRRLLAARISECTGGVSRSFRPWIKSTGKVDCASAASGEAEKKSRP